jgi:hypothetical protein
MYVVLTKCQSLSEPDGNFNSPALGFRGEGGGMI